MLIRLYSTYSRLVILRVLKYHVRTNSNFCSNILLDFLGIYSHAFPSLETNETEKPIFNVLAPICFVTVMAVSFFSQRQLAQGRALYIRLIQ